jgi:D-sedoheptulose 7-phosphate isomerase
MSDKYINDYLKGAVEIIEKLDHGEIEKMIALLLKVKKNKGRLFLLGVGGGAANCSHAVNDFRKICHIETYAPTDNVGELTARTNDDGWETVFVNWLKGSHLSKKDAVMVFSVGGGNLEKNISANIVKALQYVKEIKATILGIVSRSGGYTKQVADACVLIPVVAEDKITPFAEAFQAVIWHCVVFHPKLRSIEPY